MSINREKTKCLLFNQAKKYDFIPELSMSNNTRLEVVEGMKLVLVPDKMGPKYQILNI